MAIQEDPSVPPAPRPVASEPAEERLAVPRRVPAAQGLRWFVEGWRMFRRHTATWLGLALVITLVMVAVAAVPGIGQVAVLFALPLFAGGLMIGCRRIDRGDEIELADLFAGFRHHTLQLVLISAIAVALAAASLVLAYLGAGWEEMMRAAREDSVHTLSGKVVFAALLLFTTSILINLAMWLAPALVVLHRERASRAMFLSFAACMRNILPVMLFGVILLVLATLASVPLFLGWLVLGPVMAGATYAAYRDVFIAPRLAPGGGEPG